MPKIIFRPNPGPPPFVPPTPTYDTIVYAKSNPFPIHADDEFTIVFSQANVPAFEEVKIWAGYEPLQQSDELAIIIMSNEDFGEEMSASSNLNSDLFPYLTIVFYKDNDVVHEANLILSQL